MDGWPYNQKALTKAAHAVWSPSTLVAFNYRQCVGGTQNNHAFLAEKWDTIIGQLFVRAYKGTVTSLQQPENIQKIAQIFYDKAISEPADHLLCWAELDEATRKRYTSATKRVVLETLRSLEGIRLEGWQQNTSTGDLHHHLGKPR